MNNECKEIFCIAQEECAEVSQAISKIFRFGCDSEHNGRTNKQRLEEEVGDLLAMIDIMVEKCLVSDSAINEARYQKRNKLKIWSSIQGI